MSDDEASTELQSVNVKTEPGTSKNAANALEIGLIDLTDDIFEDVDIPRHYISWLSDLLEKAKIQPIVVEQQPREETATASTDVVVIEEPTESGQVSSVTAFAILSTARFFTISTLAFHFRSIHQKVMWQMLACMQQTITACPPPPITLDLCLRVHAKM